MCETGLVAVSLGVVVQRVAEALPDDRARLGSRIGPYQHEDVLGSGGMGTVYHATQTEPVRRQVSLKVNKLGMDTRAVLSRFEGERQVLATMEHPGTGATADGRPYS